MLLNLFGHLAPPIWCKSAFFVFFVCFRPYVGQPDDQICRVSHINALSINLSYWPKDQILKFSRNNMYRELAVLKNLIFLSRPFWFFFTHPHENQSQIMTMWYLEWLGLYFFDYDGLQPKITPPKHFSRQCTYIFYCLLY